MVGSLACHILALPSLHFLVSLTGMSRPSFIAFTPVADSSDLWKDGQQQPQQEKAEPVLDGAAARAFYEALIA